MEFINDPAAFLADNIKASESLIDIITSVVITSVELIRDVVNYAIFKDMANFVCHLVLLSLLLQVVMMVSSALYIPIHSAVTFAINVTEIPINWLYSVWGRYFDVQSFELRAPKIVHLSLSGATEFGFIASDGETNTKYMLSAVDYDLCLRKIRVDSKERAQEYSVAMQTGTQHKSILRLMSGDITVGFLTLVSIGMTCVLVTASHVAEQMADDNLVLVGKTSMSMKTAREKYSLKVDIVVSPDSLDVTTFLFNRNFPSVIGVSPVKSTSRMGSVEKIQVFHASPVSGLPISTTGRAQVRRIGRTVQTFELEHTASTWKGSSGSPIICERSGNYLGCHTGFSNTSSKNLATSAVFLHHAYCKVEESFEADRSSLPFEETMEMREWKQYIEWKRSGFDPQYVGVDEKYFRPLTTGERYALEDAEDVYDEHYDNHNDRGYENQVCAPIKEELETSIESEESKDFQSAGGEPTPLSSESLNWVGYSPPGAPDRSPRDCDMRTSQAVSTRVKRLRRKHLTKHTRENVTQQSGVTRTQIEELTHSLHLLSTSAEDEEIQLRLAENLNNAQLAKFLTYIRRPLFRECLEHFRNIGLTDSEALMQALDLARATACSSRV
jgi:hypothetical protein